MLRSRNSSSLLSSYPKRQQEVTTRDSEITFLRGALVDSALIVKDGLECNKEPAGRSERAFLGRKIIAQFEYTNILPWLRKILKEYHISQQRGVTQFWKVYVWQMMQDVPCIRIRHSTAD